MANRTRKGAKRLIRYGGKVVTLGHAGMCVAKGFKGCSKREISAIVKVVQRAAEAASRRKS